MSIIEQLEKRFDELAHTDIEKEREWFWYGVASYCKLKWELIPKSHYDISNFKPFDKVLVRDSDVQEWRCNWFSHYSGEGGVYRFVTTKCGYFQCIPFEGNEHLLGTTDMPSEEYINW